MLARGLVILWAVAGTLVAAQQSGGGASSAAQVFNGLSPDQQQAILQRLSGQGGSGGSNQGAANNGPGQRPSNNGAQNSTRATSASQSMLSPIPQFMPEDSVLIEINLPGDKTVAQLAADVYARELNASALQALGGQALAMGSNLANASDAVSSTVPAAAGAMPSTAPGVSAQKASPQSARDRQLGEAQRLIKVIRAGNPYLLDQDGVLQLPGFRPIELYGLTEAEATRRLALEPALQNFEIKVLRLPLRKIGAKALQPYGYDIFDVDQQGLSPLTSGSVPPEYLVGPDDVLEVQLYGSQNYTQQLRVNRDGQVNFPQLGPIVVGGQRFATVQREIEGRVSRQMIGVHASVSMNQTRTISVFVLGEARFPGSYPITGLATVTSALFAAGGVKSQGSLRHIQVRRHGVLVREFDLYDLLMRGDSSADVNLLAGDVVMIPSVGPTASVEGEVQRPAIYELKGPTSIESLVQMAGGLTPEADAGTASLVHVNAARQRVVVEVDMGVAESAARSVGNGDLLRVARLKPQIDSGVALQGYVWRPGNFAWHEGLRLADILGSVDELKPNADQSYVLIRRELMPGRRISVLSADLAAALREPASPANILLQARDTITVFDLQTGRDRIIEPLMQELALQSNLLQPIEVVHVDGKVKVPGDYPLETGMRVSDLIRAGGNLDSSAYGGHAELSRYTVVDGEQRRTEVMAIDLASVARGDAAADLPLQPFDQLSVKEISGWTEQDQVVLTGEVKFPGTYTIKRGETLRSVIARAGGLTDLAYPDGSVFTREELRVREQQQLERLGARMQKDIASLSMMTARAGENGAAAAYSLGQGLLAQIQSARAVGRLVIDLSASVNAAAGTANDIVLRNGDQLTVPKVRQDVMVLGEVQSASSHLFQPSLSRDDYLAQSGGLTRQADRSKIYVVRANGSVVANGGRWWSRTSSVVDMHPGDAVVVPLDTERIPALPFWQSVTQILYNIAIAAAAVHSL